MGGGRAAAPPSFDCRSRVAATPSAAKSPMTAVAAAALVGVAPPKRRAVAIARACFMPPALDSNDDERLRERFSSRFSATLSFALAAPAFTFDGASEPVFVSVPDPCFALCTFAFEPFASASVVAFVAFFARPSSGARPSAATRVAPRAISSDIRRSSARYASPSAASCAFGCVSGLMESSEMSCTSSTTSSG